MNNYAFTLVELMMAVAFTVLLMTGVYSFYNASSQIYSSGISSQALEDGANIILKKITNGEAEAGGIYRLSTSSSYNTADGINHTFAEDTRYSCGGPPQTTPCNANNTPSELYFCQDNPETNPCGLNDTTARWYYLNSTGTAVIYHHPAGAGTTVEEVLYTAPAGSIITLRFPPASVVTNQASVLEIDVAIVKNTPAGTTNNAVTVSGSASTFVLLRNHP